MQKIISAAISLFSLFPFQLTTKISYNLLSFIHTILRPQCHHQFLENPPTMSGREAQRINTEHYHCLLSLNPIPLSHFNSLADHQDPSNFVPSSVCSSSSVLLIRRTLCSCYYHSLNSGRHSLGIHCHMILRTREGNKRKGRDKDKTIYQHLKL